MDGTATPHDRSNHAIHAMRTSLGRLTAVSALTSLPLLALACAGPLGSIAMEAGRSLLRGVSDSNYDANYTQTLDKLLDALVNRDSSAGAEHPIALAAVPAGAQPVEDAEPAAAAEPEPLELEVAVLREVIVDGRPLPVPVEDGDVLLDGVGREGTGDNLKIRFEVSEPCYVYAVWIDATAWATPLFPSGLAGTFANPVRAGDEVTLPGDGSWLYLDDYRGVETLYFVASRTPLADLEAVLAELEGRERSFRADIAEPATVGEPTEITRGLAGVRPGRAQGIVATDGTAHAVESQAFLAELAAGDLVVTRWFRHQ